MSAQVANNNIMSLIEMSTGLTLPMIVQNQAMTEDFNNRLRARQRASQ
jgi:hypothetical protein